MKVCKTDTNQGLNKIQKKFQPIIFPKTKRKVLRLKCIETTFLLKKVHYQIFSQLANGVIFFEILLPTTPKDLLTVRKQQFERTQCYTLQPITYTQSPHNVVSTSTVSTYEDLTYVCAIGGIPRQLNHQSHQRDFHKICFFFFKNQNARNAGILYFREQFPRKLFFFEFFLMYCQL